MQSKHLVIGLGEVGSAVRTVLNCDGYDISMKAEEPIRADVIDICFPYSENFVEQVKLYQNVTGARLVVVHSTVPLGTCDPHDWIHSPVRGVHPNMVQGLRTFVKYFGGKNALEASNDWAALGINVKSMEQAKHCEALKLWDTTQYGIMIAMQKEIKAYCDRHDLNFEVVYTDANHTYDIGYEELSRPEVCRPYLKHVDGPIGGHCVIPNAHLLVKGEKAEDMNLALEMLYVNSKQQSAQKE